MKVLEVREAAGGRSAIALHGKVTVVRGLDPLRRAWLLRALGGLVAAEVDADTVGEIEIGRAHV